MEYRFGMILQGVSFYLQDKKRLIIKTITKKVIMEKTENKGGWDRVESNIERLPPFAAPLVRKYMPQYKAASDKAYKVMADAALQFAKEGERIIIQMFDELKKEADRCGYGFAAIMKKEAEMKARLAATRNKMAAGMGANSPKN